MKTEKTAEKKNIQDEVIKIHAQYGTSEMANYKIQLLFDEYEKQMKAESFKEGKAKGIHEAITACVNYIDDHDFNDVMDKEEILSVEAKLIKQLNEKP